MSKQATASTSYINSLVKVATNAGIDTSSILQEVGISSEILKDPDARIPFRQFLEAWHCAIRDSGDPCLGISASKLFHPSTYGPLSCVILTSPTIGEVANQIIRFEYIPETGTDSAIDLEGNLAYIQIEGKGKRFDDEFIRPIIEYALTEPIYIAKFVACPEFTDRIIPEKICFRHSPAIPESEYERKLGAPVLFNQPHNRIYFSPEILEFPTSFSDPMLFNSLITQIEKRHHKKTDSFSDRVREYIIQHLPNGVPAMKDVADHFHLSYRTFQRHLDKSGYKYLTLVSNIRQELAQHLLEENEVSISEIAFLLGFNESSAFHKAFRRWQGISPGEYRKVSLKKHSQRS